MENLKSIIESILFVSGNAVAVRDISEKLAITDKEVLDAAKELQTEYAERGVNLLIFNKKLQFCSNPENAENVSIVLNPIKERELSRNMLEVAAIIAYKQPVTRLELENLRGLNSEYAIQNLLKLGVIEIVGRKNTVGHPVLFGTTDKFLKRFQISSIDDLPDYNLLLDKIAEIKGIPQGSNYLFQKDEYVEGRDNIDTKKAISEAAKDLVNGIEKSEQPIEDLTAIGIKVETNKDFELTDIDDEEIPDFLKGENIDVVE